MSQETWEEARLLALIVALTAERDEARAAFDDAKWAKSKLIALTRERDEALAFATELQQVMLDPIACDVRLPPATTLRTGVSFATLRAAIEQRKGRDVEFIPQSAGLLAEERIASLTAELNEARAAIDQFPFRQMENLVNENVKLKTDINKARAQAFADAIQAVDWSLCDEAEDQDLFTAHRDFFADAIRTRAALSARSDAGRD